MNLDNNLTIFKKCLLEQTLIYNVDNVFDKNEKFIKNRKLIEINSVYKMLEIINLNDFDPDEISKKINDFAIKNKNNLLLNFHITWFGYNLEQLLKQVDFSYDFDIFSLNYLNYLNLFLYISNSFDQLNSLIYGAIFNKLFVKNFDFDNDFEFYEKISKDYLNFSKKQLRSFYFEKNLWKLVMKEIDIAKFYKFFILERRNIYTHHSQITSADNNTNNIHSLYLYLSNGVIPEKKFFIQKYQILYEIYFTLLYKIIFLESLLQYDINKLFLDVYNEYNK